MIVAATAKSAAPPIHQRARGLGRIGAYDDHARTRLRDLREEGCAKIRFPKTHDPSLQAVLINTAGGLTGGDRIDWHIDAGADARIVLTTQACERVYRTLDDPAEIAVAVTAGPLAHVDWLPQETILFERSALERTIDVHLAPDATFFAVEAVVLGRHAMGEDAPNARLADRWNVRRGEKLVHAEATRLGLDPGTERRSASLLDGALAFATLLYIGDDAGRRLDAIRPLLDKPTLGASMTGERLVLRAMAPSGMALRRMIAPLVANLSGAGALPRLWHI